MGLLDDAIREHLELRRRHGADPSEVLGKEQEAFGAEAACDDGPSSVEADTLFAAAQPSTLLAEDRRSKRVRSREWDDNGLGQPTVELDMQAVLDEESTRARLGYGASDASQNTAGTAPARILR